MVTLTYTYHNNFYLQWRNKTSFDISTMSMKSMITFFSVFVVGVFSQNLTEIKSCNDFAETIENVNHGDLTVSMYPFADIECLNHTTFNITSGNKLTIVSTENLDNYYGSSNFVNVRMNVDNGSSLSIENNVVFHTPDRNHDDLPDVNGGSFYVGKNSEVRFLNEFKTQYIGVRSQTVDGSDFPDHQNSGGVIYNSGKFVVEGLAIFENCENSGGGEGSPGPGGCVYNDGYMLFKNGVEMSDVSIIDDEGNDGAGFHNKGSVRVSGPSKFSRMFAESAGAIFNEKDSLFIFKKGSSVVFNECKASDGVAGAVFNDGFMKFAGPALFLESRSYYQGGAIVVGKYGEMKLSQDAIFFGNFGGDSGAPVYVRDGGIFKFNADKASFIDNSGYEDSTVEECLSIYDESKGKCIV